MPRFGVISETLEREGGSMSGDEDFFSVARTTPLVAFDAHQRKNRKLTLGLLPLMPREVTP